MRIKQSDTRWVVLFSLVVVIITSIPYLIAYSYENKHHFTGFVFGVEDGNSYLAKMLSGANDAWLFKSPYSAYDQKGFLAFLPYILLGKLTSPPGQHDQLIALFQLYRVGACFFLIFSIYRFFSHFIEDVWIRRIATAVASIGGGLGGLSVFGVHNLLNIELPLEFYSPETFGFLSIFGLPHLAIARALLLTGMTIYLQYPQSIRSKIFSSLCWVLIGFFQPLTIVTGWAVIGLHLVLVFLSEIIQRKSIKGGFSPRWKNSFTTAAWMVATSSPWVIYNLVSFASNSYLSGWESQNIIKSPPFTDYLFSFGLIIPFVLAGFWQMITNRAKPKYLLPLAYIVAFPILAYAPYNLQRRLPEGIWVVLILVCFLYLEMMRKPMMKIASYSILVVSLFTSLIILVGAIQVVRNPDLPVFRPVQEVKAFEFLNENAAPRSVVLASYETSNVLPAWAPVSVLIGHGPESINFKELDPIIHDLFSGDLTEEEINEILDKFGVDYLFWGPFEQVDSTFKPEEIRAFHLIFEQNGYQIYEVSELR